MQGKKGSKRIEMIIKKVNEFKLTVFHLRAQTRCKSVHARGFTAGQQNCVGLRATGPPGHRATGPPGHRAPGPPGRRAAGPSRAVGRGPLSLRAAGPLGRGGPWAAGRWAVGLLLAKPFAELILVYFGAIL